MKFREIMRKAITGILSLAVVSTLLSPTSFANAASDCNINVNAKKQMIQGFGGINHPVWTSDLTAAQRETAFGNGTNQLGFTILRIHVDENSSNWSKELATAKAAAAKGALIFASPWNPPASMTESFTRNGQPNQRRLRYNSYGAYAKHLNDFVTYMKNNGVNLYAISIQNEPDWGSEWTWWTPQEVLNFMKNYAGSINCKVIAPESFSYSKSLSDPILNDATALKNMDILGTHFYGTSKNNMSYPLFQQKGAGKELWMTEVYVPNSDANSADRWPESIKVSENIHDAMVTGNMQAYVWWYIRRSYGPMKEDGSISKRGYCMAQYSKFVRRGYVRVDATEKPNSNVLVSAYTGDNKIVVVATNENSYAVTQKFNLGRNATAIESYRTSASENLKKTTGIGSSNGSFTQSLPGNSVTTFVATLGSSVVTPTPTPKPTTTVTPKPVVLNDGWYYIKSVSAQKYLQVKDNLGKNVQNVEIGTGTGAAGQKWYLKNNSDNSITLTSGLGDYMLDIGNGSADDGANVQIYSAWGGDAQKYFLRATSTNGCYTIATKASDGTKNLDVYERKTEDGTNVCQWSATGNTNQQWIFETINNQTPSQTPTPKPTTTATPTAKPTVTPTPTPATTSVAPSNDITYAYKVVGDWGSTYQAEIVVTNKSNKTYNGWTLTCNYNDKITNLWGAELSGQEGTKVTIKNPSWDANLAPGASVTINFIASGTNKSAPIGYTFG